MKLQTADARHEKTWHQFLSELEKQPRLRLAAIHLGGVLGGVQGGV